MFRKLPNNPTIKHIYSILSTLFLFVVISNQHYGVLHILLGSLVPYFITLFVKGSLAPKLVFVFAMAHMSYTHIYRQIYDYGGFTMDHSGPQMIMTIKITSFAWCVYDGSRSEKQLSTYQKSKVIRQFPSLLEYLGYIFFFGSFMVGPPIEFADYQQFTSLEVFKDEKTGKLVIPNGLPSGLRCLVSGITCLLCTVFVSPNYPIEFCLSSIFYRFFYINVVALMNRFKYYSVWLMAEGACDISGLGFNGYANGEAQWNRVSNVNIVGYETAQSPKMLVESWNTGVNKWLKNYVYLRVTPPNTKPTFVTTFLTFGVSAFWHGFYPGYYLMFLSAAFLTNVANSARKVFRPRFLESDLKTPTRGKIFYDALGWFATQTGVNYMTMSFLILSFKESHIIWSANYYIVHAAVLVMMTYFSFVRVKVAPHPASTKPMHFTKKAN
ncbi:MBOAT-domain-containing protein [Basidiobolus meristosporus CBS 931.73]|uniref:MBOAT-domain-containing protein n=1 Tax=Basidiobolus meristosporus CBS 931.73 TaxID=1314790 RepID=A0A1Y1ZE68_9FUNG|nr:MBOAT-domain-containing protein [Basidiobolus meristosporus CBS 931.73]|eukprot:ORY08115.1 MBOAT-domain-containing protein [Basidiobolus meristosporus CBS 931.73]